MKKLTTKLMIATAALVVASGAAWAQTVTAKIPFEFRADSRVMAPGTYRVELSNVNGARVIRLVNFRSGNQAMLLAQVPVAPQKAWEASGEGRLVFACTSGRCALAEIWTGSGSSRAYTIHRPKLGKDEDAYLREITLQPGKAE